MTPNFADSGRLLARLIHAIQNGEPVTFLFGSAVTAPGGRPDELGVPDANTLIEEAISSFRGTSEFEALDNLLKQCAGPARYQETMQFVID